MYVYLEEVDGETLLMLSSCATMEQLKACGLRTVKQQLLLRKLLSPVQHSVAAASSTPASGTVAGTSKLTISAMKAMSEEDRRLYLIK